MGVSKTPFEFTLQFGSQIGNVNSQSGILTGVSVAEVGPATGHYAFADAKNNILGVGGREDGAMFKGAVKRLQLAMDAESLLTVVAAGKQSLRYKTREDHDDSIAARAGKSQNFRLIDGKVVCDVSIFDAYANRAVFLETAEKTPELIGLSGDFKFTTEVIGDMAMMRVTRIDAIDIVDQGALTHAGLFKVKPQVDTPSKENLSIMATSAPVKPDLKAFKQMCAEVAAYRAANAQEGESIDDCMADLIPKPAAGEGQTDDEAAKTKSMNASEKADLTKELTTALSAVFTAKIDEMKGTIKTEVETATKAQAVEFGKKMSALGLKFEAGKEPTPADLAAAVKAGEDAAALAAGKEDFLALKAARAKEKNIKPSEAAVEIMREKPAVYEAHLKKLGVVRAA